MDREELEKKIKIDTPRGYTVIEKDICQEENGDCICIVKIRKI